MAKTLRLFVALALFACPALPKAATLTTLVHFNSTNGQNPSANLIQGADGNFYGTTLYGGSPKVAANPAGYGTLFKLTPGGTLTTLVNFNITNGANPQAGLVQDAQGNLYGSTLYDSSYSTGKGSVFKLTSGGTLTTLVSGVASPLPANLLLATDGSLYSTNLTSAYKVTTSGALTSLVTFTTTNGELPFAGLIQGTDGNFYGTTSQGGTNDVGTVFKLTPSGALNTLVNFNTTNGAYPYAGVIQGTDGNFYGTTSQGGTGGQGTVFQLKPDGTLTTLANFNTSNGANPFAGVIQAKDGNFYGTTYQGGDSGLGTVYQVTPSGLLTTLLSFNSLNGANPRAGLVQGTNGNLYGTTLYGGAYGNGSIYQLSTAISQTATFATASTVPITANGYSINGTAFNLTLGFAPTSGTVLTLIHNTGTTPINGTYSNLPNGSTIVTTYNGATYTFLANYAGGAGYDLTLTLTANAPPETDTPLLPTWALLALIALFLISGSALKTRRN